MTTIIIDSAHHGDVDDLIYLRSYLLSGGQGLYAAQSPDEDKQWRSTYRDWLQTQIEAESQSVWIAVARHIEGGAPIGCAIGLVQHHVPGVHTPTGETGWIQTVVVASEYRGHGVGSRLVSALTSWFTAKGIREISLETTPKARGMYSRLGFNPSGEELLYRHESSGENA